MAEFSVSICRNCGKVSNLFRSIMGFGCFLQSQLQHQQATSHFPDFPGMNTLGNFKEAFHGHRTFQCTTVVGLPQPLHLCVGNVLIKSGVMVLHLSFKSPGTSSSVSVSLPGSVRQSVFSPLLLPTVKAVASARRSVPGSIRSWTSAPNVISLA